MMNRSNLLLLIIAASLASCEIFDKPKDPAPTTTEPFKARPLSVLKDQSGFEVVYDTAFLRNELLGGILGKIGNNDFTVEAGNLFILYYTTRPTQQDEFSEYKMISMGLSTKAETELTAPTTNYPSYVDKRFYQNSNRLFEEANVSGSDYTTAFDFMSYRNEVTPKNPYGGFAKNDGKFLTASLYLNSKELKGYLLKRDVYTSNGVEQYFNTLIANDSIKLVQTTFLDEGSATTYPNTQDNVVFKAFFSSVGKSFVIADVQYLDNGQRMVMLLHDLTNQKYTSIKVDFAAKTVTTLLGEQTFDFAGTGTDVCTDADGNMYYTGNAGNGSNTAGVTIYKKSSAGTSLVGADDILVAGTVVQLKWIEGKIWFVVTANQTYTATTPKVHQISYVRQQ